MWKRAGTRRVHDHDRELQSLSVSPCPLPPSQGRSPNTSRRNSSRSTTKLTPFATRLATAEPDWWNSGNSMPHWPPPSLLARPPSECSEPTSPRGSQVLTILKTTRLPRSSPNAFQDHQTPFPTSFDLKHDPSRNRVAPKVCMRAPSRISIFVLRGTRCLSIFSTHTMNLACQIGAWTRGGLSLASTSRRTDGPVARYMEPTGLDDANAYAYQDDLDMVCDPEERARDQHAMRSCDRTSSSVGLRATSSKSTMTPNRNVPQDALPPPGCTTPRRVPCA